MQSDNHRSLQAHEQLGERWRSTPRRFLFLDYDGTLREIAPEPQLAVPTPAIVKLLADLAATPATAVHVVSGRSRVTLQAWLGDLPIHLGAEHGLATRAPGGDWRQRETVTSDWLPFVRERLLRACATVPGAHIETKPAGIAWHYRLADPAVADAAIDGIRRDVAVLLESHAATLLAGHCVLEVRPSGVDKGSYARDHLQGVTAEDFVLCAGDDRTDFDMFRSMPEHAAVFHIGSDSGTGDRHRPLGSPAELRQLLQSLLTRGVM